MLKKLEDLLKTRKLVVCLLIFATLPFVAQTAKSKRVVHLKEESIDRITPQAAPVGLKILYSNLGTKTNLYLDTDGWSITGFNSYGGEKDAFAIALPFTPKSNSHVTQVRVAVQYLGFGANQVNLSIYGDTNGTPGARLAGPVTVTNLPHSGTCCALTVASFTPLAVTAGTQYWVVADTPVSGQGSDFTGVWDWVSKVMIFGGTNGVNGWVAENGATYPAGEVVGSIP